MADTAAKQTNEAKEPKMDKSTANVRPNSRGRPRKYETPEQMQIEINKYFEEEDKPTICGLALALGFAQRSALLTYEGYSKEYYNVIKRAKLRVEANYEHNLHGTTPTGSIFALKNMGWKDKQGLTLNAGDDLKGFLGWLDSREEAEDKSGSKQVPEG